MKITMAAKKIPRYFRRYMIGLMSCWREKKMLTKLSITEHDCNECTESKPGRHFKFSLYRKWSKILVELFKCTNDIILQYWHCFLIKYCSQWEYPNMWCKTVSFFKSYNYRVMSLLCNLVFKYFVCQLFTHTHTQAQSFMIDSTKMTR